MMVRELANRTRPEHTVIRNDLGSLGMNAHRPHSRMLAPESVRTPRLLLRPWRAEDAPRLLPVLEANQSHLGSWIPRRVSEPAPLPALAARLAGFGADFAAAREWRYALFTPDGGTVVGEVGLYPRDSHGRVPFAAADRVEIGYWLRADMTGRGLATEATEAVLAIASSLPTLGHAEIRCDARNAPSAALPRRLGFALAETQEEAAAVAGDPPVVLQVWTHPLPRASVASV